jgi:hypothetical protein
MTIPDKATRLDKFLKFNATTGNPEASTVTDVYVASGFQNYNFTGNGSTTAFTLGIAPLSENNTQVYIDGVYQEKGTYSVSGTTLTFSTAPPNLSGIEVMVVEVLPSGSNSAANVTFKQAGSSTQRTVQLKLQESVSVLDFGADPTGVTDSTTAIQAAFAASLSVYFPVGTYVTSSPIKLGDGNARRIYGASRLSAKIENATSDIFEIETNDAGYLHMNDLEIRSLPGGGHCFKISTNSSMMAFDNLVVRQDNADKSIWDQQAGYCGLVTWDQCRFYANSTVNLLAHPFNIQSTDIVNGWSFKNIRCEKTLGTLQFFNLNSENTSSFNTNCTFQNITFQEPYGGWIKLGGCRAVEIINCASYDMSQAQTGHGILITQSAGGKSSSRCKISHCGRYPSAGGVLAAGIQDIKLDSGAGFFAQNCMIEACANSSAGATFTVDYGNNSTLHIDRPGPSESSYTNADNVQFIDLGGDNQGSGMAASRTIPTTNDRELTIASGSITPIFLYQIVDTEGGAASDDLDTIVGTNMLAGDILTLRNVTSGRSVTLKDGTGNLALEGDFVLSNDKDTIQLLWNGSSFQETSRSNNS